MTEKKYEVIEYLLEKLYDVIVKVNDFDKLLEEYRDIEGLSDIKEEWEEILEVINKIAGKLAMLYAHYKKEND